MAPSKVLRGGHDDSKSDAPAAAKDKAGHSNNHQSNGKLRRVASSTGSNLREVTNAAGLAAHATGGTAQEQSNLKVRLLRNVREASLFNRIPHANLAFALQLEWPLFEREMLHSYRRTYRLNTPTAFSSEYRQWVLSRPGSIGLHSPTMARRQEFRRQSKDQLATTVRKHFNGLGVQENDVIVDFLHKVKSQGVVKPTKAKRIDYESRDH